MGDGLDREKIGGIIVVLGTIVGAAGTIANNLLLDHFSAMIIWRWSNILLFAFFIGLWRKWWSASIGSEVMCLLYGLYIFTNEWGLSH